MASTCESCGAEFATRPTRPRRFCSVACYRAAQRSGRYPGSRPRTRPVVLCDHCGTPHVRMGSRKRDGTPAEHSYCSRACYLAEHSAKRAWTCAGCGETREAPKAWTGKTVRRFCSMACRVNTARPVASTCKQCGVQFSALKWHSGRTRYSLVLRETCGDACLRAFYRTNEARKAKIGAANRGERSQWWKGGLTALNDGSYRGRDWPRIAERVRERDGRACRDCDKTEAENGRKLDVHHVVPFHNFATAREANRLSNLVALCWPCHRRREHDTDAVQLTIPLSTRGRGRVGLRGLRGAEHPRAKLTEADARAIRATLGRETAVAVAARYGVSKGTVDAIRAGYTWRHVA